MRFVVELTPLFVSLRLDINMAHLTGAVLVIDARGCRVGLSSLNLPCDLEYFVNLFEFLSWKPSMRSSLAKRFGKEGRTPCACVATLAHGAEPLSRRSNVRHSVSRITMPVVIQQGYGVYVSLSGPLRVPRAGHSPSRLVAA